MLHVIGCIAATNDLRFVFTACCICLVGSLATFQMLARAKAARHRARYAWAAGSAVAFGCNVWVTHFLAMLGYAPGMPTAFDLPLTGASLLVALAGGVLAQSCILASGRGSALAGGLLMGGTIGVMHGAGMEALRVPGVLEYGTEDVIASWLFGFVFGPLAVWRFRTGRTVQAAAFLVVAVAGVHFLSIASVSIRPNGAHVDGTPVTVLAIGVAAVGLFVLLASLGTAMVDALLHRRAAREDARFRRFADATFEGLFFMRNGTVTDVNAVLCRMLGRSPAEVVGAPLWSFFAPSRRAALEALTSGGIEVEMIDDLGGALVVDLLARPLSEGEDAEIVVAVRDASERKRAERRIQELVHIDPLTGLANRLLMRDRLAQALAMAERAGSQVAVLCLDLDKFKAVNDVMGHHAGDALLAEAANRLRAETRDTDTIARLGGDEFLVIQPFEGEPTSARVLAQRLVQVLSAPFLIEGAPIHVGASIGVALYPNDAAAPEMLLKLADLALYRAKHDGRCCWRFFEKSMDTKLRARREMEQDLRQAIARRELSLCYQPVFSAKGLVLTGYEALLRWTHPVRGAIRPDVFIPLAEECGMIAAIGRWVLETACAEAASWPERHSIAVNLSPAQFDDADFAAQVTAIMAKAGLAPERLELEVTEGLLIKDSDAALRILAALKAQGIRIALDDFGTGYSSLSYLRRFEFDRLKIDRSFIAELGTNDEADALVRTILAMSRSLHLDVTAEGVETERQLSILQELRCDSVQGYLLGRPQPTVLSVNAGGTACLVQ